MGRGKFAGFERRRLADMNMFHTPEGEVSLHAADPNVYKAGTVIAPASGLVERPAAITEPIQGQFRDPVIDARMQHLEATPLSTRALSSNHPPIKLG